MNDSNYFIEILAKEFFTIIREITQHRQAVSVENFKIMLRQNTGISLMIRDYILKTGP